MSTLGKKNHNQKALLTIMWLKKVGGKCHVNWNLQFYPYRSIFTCRDIHLWHLLYGFQGSPGVCYLVRRLFLSMIIFLVSFLLPFGNSMDLKVLSQLFPNRTRIWNCLIWKADRSICMRYKRITAKRDISQNLYSLLVLRLSLEQFQVIFYAFFFRRIDILVILCRFCIILAVVSL